MVTTVFSVKEFFPVSVSVPPAALTEYAVIDVELVPPAVDAPMLAAPGFHITTVE
jgi:hypothetical protein